MDWTAELASLASRLGRDVSLTCSPANSGAEGFDRWIVRCGGRAFGEAGSPGKAVAAARAALEAAGGGDGARGLGSQEESPEPLRRAEEWVTNIFARSPLGVELYDSRGLLISANGACLEMFGVSDLAHVKGFRLFEDPNLPEQAKRQLRDGLSVRYEFGFDFELVRRLELYPTTKSGTSQLDCLILPLRAQGGLALGYLVQIQDVTERRHAESEREVLLGQLRALNDELAEASARAIEHAAEAEAARAEAQRQTAQLNTLLRDLGEGVIILDAASRIVLRNQASRQITGLSDQAAQAALFDRGVGLLRPDGGILPYEEWPYTRAMRGEWFENLEVILVQPDGSRRRLVYSGNSVHDETGKVVLAIVVYRDVTELSHLRQIEQMRADFIRTIFHDLKTPLAVALGHAATIQRLPDNVEQVRRSAEFIVSAAEQMTAMVRQLVEVAHLEAGQVRPTRGAVDPGAFVSHLGERLGGVIEVERLQVEAAPGLPRVSADPNHLERILVNLVSNALKYSPPASRVRVMVVEREGEVVISVADRGRGIAPADIPHVFERYYRTQEAREHHEGLGLGLYIAKGLVELQGGRIWVESSAGKGSTFSIALPVAR